MNLFRSQDLCLVNSCTSKNGQCLIKSVASGKRLSNESLALASLGALSVQIPRRPRNIEFTEKTHTYIKLLIIYVSVLGKKKCGE